MSNLSALVLDRQAVGGCGCFAEMAPMPMGCAACGHAPYAHGCPDRPADHEYAPPSRDLLDIRLRARRTEDRSLPCFEPPVPVAPARTIPSMPDRRPGKRASVEMPTLAEEIPPISVQRRPEQAPPVVPAIPVPSPRRAYCRLRSIRPSRPVRTDVSRLGYRRHFAPSPRRTTTCF
ncbi:hypothetical protein [Streptosporangium sp. CA-115845]|uniref:hypothetical protein n=1 Tax=Streptosporangium sp. CA-115845 TaxID=3240071 RepID=UPI003D8FCCBD